MPSYPHLIRPMIYFTESQRLVLEAVGQGLDNKQIAAKLNKEIGAIYFHVRSLKAKLQLADDRALVLWAVLHPEDLREGRTREYGVNERKAA